MTTRKIFLIAFICSVVAAAAIGILGIVSKQYGDGKLLGTMASIALFSLTALGSAIVMDKQRWRPLMSISFGVSAIGAAWFIFMIYFEQNFDWDIRRIIGKTAGLLAVAGIALPLGGLLSLTRFEHTMLQAVRVTGITIVYITAGIFVFGILGDPDQDYFKVLGVALILTALSVVCLPVLHKVAGMPPPSETVASDVRITIICPRCALQQSLSSGPSRCERCRLKFTIEVEEPRCPKCHYLLYQLTEPRCPECGTPIDVSDVIPLESASQTASV